MRAVSECIEGLLLAGTGESWAYGRCDGSCGIRMYNVVLVKELENMKCARDRCSV